MLIWIFIDSSTLCICVIEGVAHEEVAHVHDVAPGAPLAAVSGLALLMSAALLLRLTVMCVMCMCVIVCVSASACARNIWNNLDTRSNLKKIEKSEIS